MLLIVRVSDSQLLDPKERLVAYEQFLQTEKIAKKRLQEENLSDLLLEDSSAQSGKLLMFYCLNFKAKVILVLCW